MNNIECHAPGSIYSSGSCPTCAYLRGTIMPSQIHILADFRHEAEGRAFRALMSYLSPEQQETVRKHRYFAVVGSAGGHYRIDVWGGTYNIKHYDPDTGKILVDFCLSASDGFLPSWDVYLTQALEFITNELVARGVANRRTYPRFRTMKDINIFVKEHYQTALPS